MNEPVITNHAVDRFRERSGATYSDERIRDKLLKFYHDGKRVELKDKYKALALLNHGFKKADYVDYNGWILVLIKDECESEIIVTIHTNQAKRWVSL